MTNREKASRLIVAWEITRRCGLNCRHCRGASRAGPYSGELSTEECFKVIDGLIEFGPAMIILTGGEPLTRGDIFDVAEYADKKGCRVVLATCGHMLTVEIARRLKSSGVMAVSVSLDSHDPRQHDEFRGVPGAFGKTLTGLSCLQRAGVPFQINTTVSKLNAARLPDLLGMAIELGAAALDFFFLVPTGRGTEIADLELPSAERDRALEWIAEQTRTAPIRIKTTCAPQYGKFIQAAENSEASQTEKNSSTISSSPFRGCMGGRGFVFISHIGILQPCGFLDVNCGDLRAADFDFGDLYRNSEVFTNMRALNPYAGCPARTYARTGDYMKDEN